MQLRRAATPRVDIHPRDLPFWALLPLWAVGAWALVIAMVWPWGGRRFGADAHAYFRAAHLTHLYTLAPQRPDAYLYSPAFAQVIHPLALLPWPIFLTVWMAVEASIFLWLLWPVGLKWGGPLFLLACATDVTLGNVNGLLALSAVLGMRYAGFWAVPLLTKVTPGLGPIWFAARGQWRLAGLAIATTAVFAGISYVISPHQWADWFTFLRTSGHHRGFTYFRYAIGVAMTIYAARRQRIWLLPLAMWIVTPVLSVVPLTMIAAIPRLLERKSAGRINAHL